MSLVQAVANDNGYGANTVSVNISASAQGSCLIAIVGRNGRYVTGVSDSAGQSYVSAFTPNDAVEASAMWVCPNSQAGVTWITANISTAQDTCIFGIEESGVVTSSCVDKYAAPGPSGPTTSWDSGNAPTTSQANTVGFGIAVETSNANGAFVPAAGWSALTGANITAGHHGNTLAGEDLFVMRREFTSTGNYNANGTSGNYYISASIVLLKQGAAGQTLRPASDLSAGNWTASTGNSIYAMLDETTRDDSDYAKLPGTTPSTFKVALSSGNDPLSSSNHVLSYVLQGNHTVRLVQDANTTIASWNEAVGATFTLVERTLNASQADSITNYGNLSVEFTAVT
jgi:hypothetical protein